MASEKEGVGNYSLASRIIYRVLFVIAILIALMFIVFVLLKKVLIGIVSILFDGDYIYKIVAWIVNLYGNIFNDAFGLKKPSTDWIPHTDQWSEKLAYTTENSGMSFLTFLFITFIALAVVYIVTIIMRHHKGEMAPLLNDRESRRMRRAIIKKIDAGYINRSGDERGNKKKYSKLDKKVQRHIRIRLKVKISTTIPNGYPMPVKQYHIRLRRGRTTKITNKILNYIKDLHTELTDITNGISFDQMKTERNNRYYIFEGSQEKELKEARSVIKKREEMAQTDNNSLETGNDDIYTFPLEILSENKDKIVRQRKKARQFAEDNQGTIDMHLASIGLQVEPKDPEVGNSAIEYMYGTRFTTATKSNDEIKDSLEKALNIVGVTVYTKAKDLVINVPIPEKKRIPVDGEEIIRKVFDNEVEDPTHAVLGQGIDNKPLDFPFSEAPHTLIAGTTGSGKSVLSKFFLVSMLAKTTPDDLRMQIIDPKYIDFVPFEKSPFNFSNVITDIKNDAVPFMKYLVIMMEERFKMFKDKAGGTENLVEYNEWALENGEEKIPYIVVFIDEVADMMNQVQDEIEEPIQRLGQKGRAAGIHLIMSTQRPSREVITGLIKANLPTKLALSVGSDVDSRIILGTNGAEELNGKGDMLFSPDGSVPQRAQGANITRKQLNAVFDALNEKFEKPVYPDYHAKVAREEAKENGEEYDESANENFAAVSALQQSRLEIDNDNELNQEHSSEKTVNKKKSDSERTEEEQKALQKAIASREKRKKERQNKHQEEPKPKIQIDTSALVRDSEKQDNQEKEEQMDRKTKQSTSEMLGL